MEYNPLMCPVCGAPYRKVVPVGVVQVRCTYCGATVAIPSGLPRCPNHPDTVAASFCSDCRRSYCRDCLSSYTLKGESESGYLYLCPDCLRLRYLERSNRVVLFGVLFLALGLFVMLSNVVLGAFMIAVLAAPAFVYTLYKHRLYRGDTQSQVALAKALVQRRSQRTSQEIYQNMLVEYTKYLGPVHASIRLENRVQSYMKDGFSREEAVRRVAKDEGY